MAKKRPEWKDSKYADAKGKFKDLGCEACLLYTSDAADE